VWPRRHLHVMYGSGATERQDLCFRQQCRGVRNKIRNRKVNLMVKMDLQREKVLEFSNFFPFRKSVV